MSKKTDLKIMSITGGGYAGLTAVDVTLEPGVNKIGGKNRQGKSNLMALIGIFRGKEYMAEVPLNNDAEDGKFTIPLVDGDEQVKYTVNYSFTKKHSYVKVTDEDGKEVPKQILKDLLSPCMDPSEFFYNATSSGTGSKERRMKAINVIRELMKYNMSNDDVLEHVKMNADAHIKSLMSQNADDPIAFIDALDKYVCDNRAAFKVKATQKEGSIKTLKEDVLPECRKFEEIDAKDIFEKQQKLQERVTKNAVALQEGLRLEEEVVRLKSEFEASEAKLEAWRESHEEDKSELKAVEELEKLKTESEEREEHNKIARKAQDLRDDVADLANLNRAIELREGLVKKIRAERVKVLESADMPIEGLTIEGDDIMKNGIPLGQDSTEEGLTDSFKIGLAKFEAMHPDQEKLKVMLIENASIMDSEAKQRLYDLANEHDIQLIVELVMDEPCKGVIFVANGVANNQEVEDDE